MYSVTEKYAANVAEPVRMSRIYGQLRTKSGNVYEINNSDIESGSLSIVSKLNKKGDFRPGGVYSSTLSISLNKFGDISKDLDRARILLYYDLFRGVDSEEYDRIPLGSYWVNGSSVKRNFEVVSFKAYDDMINFDYSAVAMTDTLYNLAVAACSACGIVLRTTQDVFESMPNGTMTATINTARVQNWRDLLMYIGIATSSFARINRTGGLEFVPLTCEKNDGGVIIPVREIMDNIRGKTEFSDSTERIVKLTMRRNGVLISSTKVYQTAGSEILSTLEISDNPLFSSLTDAEVSAALNNMLVPLVGCLNRTFDVDVISGDPALEVGDYVRLRGGAIDTARGYATGIITYQAWRYRGDHTIKCSLPATVARDESAIPATMDDTETTTAYRQTPKSQLEKRVDALEADIKSSGGSASLGPLSTYTYLTDNSIEYNGTTYTVEKNDSGLITKIANDKGGEFAPEIDGDITDVAYHNAVFTAIAMLCGIGGGGTSSELMPVMDGVNWYYDAEHIDNETEWKNLCNNSPLSLVGATYADGVVTLEAGGTGYVDTGLTDDITIYMICSHPSAGHTWQALGGMANTKSEGNGYEILAESESSKIEVTTGAWGTSPSTGIISPPSTIYANNFVLVAMRRSGNIVTAFFNGETGKSTKECYGYSPRFVIGGYFRGSTKTLNSVPTNYKCIAISQAAHSDDEITSNSRWLKNKYSITT